MFFCEYIHVKIFFHCLISCKYAFINILQNRFLENSAKFSLKCLYQTLLILAQISWESLDLDTPFLQNTIQTTASDFSSIFLTFLFQSRSIRLIMRPILGYIKIHAHRPPGSPYFFYREFKYYWSKNNTYIKKVHFISYITLTIFIKRFTKVLNIKRFWICQCYTGFWICLNIPGWICLAEYAWIYLNIPQWLLFISPL